jgi:hypothetical protein
MFESKPHDIRSTFSMIELLDRKIKYSNEELIAFVGRRVFMNVLKEQMKSNRKFQKKLSRKQRNKKLWQTILAQ